MPRAPQKFSSAQDAGSKIIWPVDSISDKSRDAPAAAQPVVQPDKTLAKVMPAPKS